MILVEIDSLLSTNPDSALYLLRNFDVNNEDISIRAKYALLLTKAEDKNYVLHTSDSLINFAVCFYDSVGDIELSTISHYYLARVYQDMQDDVAAVHEYLIALSLAEKYDKADLLCLLYGNLGQIYFQQNLLDRADSLFALSEVIAVENNDFYNLAMGLVARGNVRLQKKEYCDVLTFYENALNIAKDLHNVNAEKIIYNSIAAFYTSIDCPKETLKYTNAGLKHEGDSLSTARLYLLQGNALIYYEKYDSAVSLINKSLVTSCLHTKSVAYSLLADIKKKQGYVNEALEYQNYYVECLDSLEIAENRVRKAIFTGAESMYWGRIQRLLSNYHIYIYGLLLVVCVLAFFLTNGKYIYRNKIRVLTNNKKLLEQKVQTLYDMQENLKRKEYELKLFQEFASNVEQEKAELYVLTNQVMVLKQNNKDFFLRLMKDTRSYKILLSLIKKKKDNPVCKESFTEKDWIVLLNDVDYFSNGFLERLKECAVLLSNTDIRFCCLFKIGLNYTEIAIVLDRTLDAMYKKRKAILENKLFNVANYDSFEDFINSI